ncbi:MAG: hypothetical protein GOVbin1709_46 [Prokaryotic dsDNA virus sp.]|nr:MAG: hypothetical protein GOVbin1709_46 [Prokaryotic dsDNA virus sp.]|tara:strand:+ start:3110 stop:3412 length:303 start_codon:yes stop_codon:yes gene_type:complete
MKAIIKIIMLSLISTVFMLLSHNSYSQTMANDFKYNKEITLKVIDKIIEEPYTNYAIALENGDTYYCTFGEFALIKIDDLIIFRKNFWGRYKFDRVIKKE